MHTIHIHTYSLHMHVYVHTYVCTYTCNSAGVNVYVHMSIHTRWTAPIMLSRMSIT